MNKKLGQNFLVNRQARERIADAVSPKESMHIWEIGPGFGSVTSLLLKSGAYVKAFEIDRGFSKLLTGKAFSDEARFSLVEGDAMKTMFSEEGIPDVICGNLPYNVGSVMVAKLIEEGILPGRMAFTLQKEVALRIVASPSSDNYSSFSILTQLDYSNSIVFLIKKGCFYPEPSVESAVIVMERREDELIGSRLRPLFFQILRTLFSQRRKTIRNNFSSSPLSVLVKRGLLEESGFTGSERAETLSVADVARMTENASKLMSVDA